MTGYRVTSVFILLLVSAGIATADDDVEESAFEFDASLRLRGEYWDNFLFNPDASDSFGLLRLLASVNFQASDSTRVFVQAKVANATERELPGGRRTIDVDTLALQQAYVEWRPPEGNVALRAGRIALAYGRQRLVSPLPWGNSLRAWDGVLMSLDVSNWDIDAFWTYFVPVDMYDSNTASSDLPFRGVYARRALAGERDAVELYWLSRERPFAEFNGTSGPERRETFGVHVTADVGAFTLDLEGALQRGSVGAGDINAAMLTIAVVRPLGDSGTKILAGLDYASGDDAAGGDVGTFHSLYPLGHAYLGYIDAVGRQNVVSAHLGVSMLLRERVELRVTGHTFRRARATDALYHAGGGVVLPPEVSDSLHVGEELDLSLIFPIGKSALLFGYSHFFTGAFLEATDSAPIDFGYLQYFYNF